MKAAYIAKPGPPEEIRVGDMPMPVIGPSDVLVKVRAVAVDPVDTYIRSGKLPMQMPFPFIIGRDVVGVVSAVGSRVTRFSPGERVWCNNQGIHGRQGTFAEYISVNESLLYYVPMKADERQLVAFVHSGLTAYTGLKRADLRAGESICIIGGAGNVGSAVLQLAKARGARVIVTASTTDGLAWCRSLGADEGVNYTTADLTAALATFAPNGVNVYWDTSGKPDFDSALARLAPRGRVIVMAGVSARPPFPVGLFYTKNAAMYGLSITWLNDAELQEAADEINRWVASSRMRVRISLTLPLAEAAIAHRLMEDGTPLKGKIVLVP